MRKWLWLALLALIGPAVLAAPWQGTNHQPFGGSSSYSGPLDVIGGSFTTAACYSVRGCSAAAAAATRNAYQLQRESDNATQDFAVQTNGVVADPTSFCSGTVCHVITWYDQTATSANNVIQATLAQAPQVTFSCVGPSSTLPCVFFSDFGQTRTLAAAAFASTTAQPYSASYIARFDTAFSNYQFIWGTTTSANKSGGGHQAGGGVMIMDDDTPFTDAVSDDGLFHSVQNVLNGASSSIKYDGTNTTGTISTTHGLTATLGIGQTNSGYGVYGAMAEVILFTTALNGTQTTNLCHDQRLWAGTGGSC